MECMRERDLRLVKHDHLCRQASRKARAACKRMKQCATKRDNDGFDQASKEFDRAVRLFDLANQELCRRPEK
ncbi:MAG: hypothetical protein CVU57_04245 [Deltaproteobacteria bacterium HGW-Deltaproteobacteria-15]|jgi:hypothetical protein|nr:MAG: hypothetical protein CVU57_04245 [Deltaproteobacteria bacterium HGW-Deltaproteobacteria-15]